MFLQSIFSTAISIKTNPSSRMGMQEQ